MSYLKIDKDGDKFWCNDKGQFHRKGRPAIEWINGVKWWCINGKCHREDGPAIEYPDGMKYWYCNGECIGCSDDRFTQEDFERFLKIKEYW